MVGVGLSEGGVGGGLGVEGAGGAGLGEGGGDGGGCGGLGEHSVICVNQHPGATPPSASNTGTVRRSIVEKQQEKRMKIASGVSPRNNYTSIIPQL